MPTDPDEILAPWLTALIGDEPLDLLDAHTHLGRHDPDGYTQAPEELLAHLARAGARAVVFPMHEPQGYPPANDAVLAAARAAPGELTAFCRIDPRTGPSEAVREAERMLDAGARGIKLHPRAERFTMDVPAVRALAAVADERRVPILIHAGRGIPALGRDTVALAAAHPGAHLILAHAAISDLAWLTGTLPEHPNVLVDTAWWSPVDLVALFALAPPASVVWASDSPYGTPVSSAVMTLRCALQAGLTRAQLRGVVGATLTAVLGGEAAPPLGPAPGREAVRALDPDLERVTSHLMAAAGRLFGDADPEEPVALARLACAVGEDAATAPVCAAVLDLLDAYGKGRRVPPPPGQRFGPAARLLLAALTVARTPDVPLPALPGAPPPTRAQAD